MKRAKRTLAIGVCVTGMSLPGAGSAGAGSAATLVFFGAFLVLTVMGPASIDHKRARALGERWEHFAAVTSRLPFAAIAQGRNSLALSELIGWRLVLALVLCGAVFYLHDWIFGVPASPL